MGYIQNLRETDRTAVSIVGGKGASLGELWRLVPLRGNTSAADVDVPDGFCVTTDAYRTVLSELPCVDDLLERLAKAEPDDIAALSTQIRTAIEECTIPGDIAEAIAARVRELGEDVPVAVRSSATAEDLPTVSFAGQQDSYLDIRGVEDVLRHVSRCWGSLFTERAVAYRVNNGFDHRKVYMAVVVQRMVFPQASGVLFTADPVTSDRTVSRVDAVAGLGDGLVSGLVNADAYAVRADEVVDRTQRQEAPVLTDTQLADLVRLGRRIEAHFGRPQDIEWCLADGVFHIVQSRPITTLFPVPEAGDDDNHVYLSVGHQQMMIDPLKPLGISMWQLTSRAPMRHAGGRLFVDVTPMLASPTQGPGIVDMIGRSDPLFGDALRTVLDRGFVPTRPDDPAAAPVGLPPVPDEIDPAVVPELVARDEAAIAESARRIENETGSALLDVIRADIRELQESLFGKEVGEVLAAGMQAAERLNEVGQEWLGERNVADVVSRSVPYNVTSEMGLALLDVADAARPYPDVVAFLRQVDAEGYDDARFLDELVARGGGPQVRAALEDFLGKYGRRCVGEIDITRPRWGERPTMLVPMIVSNLDNFETGAAAQRFDDGRRQAEEKKRELLERVRGLPDGEQKEREIERLVDRVRAFAGYREYPKYGMIGRYFVYKQALLREAERLVRAGVIDDEEDIFFLRFDELEDVVRAPQPVGDLVAERKREFASFAALTPPRVLLSTGETLTGAYSRDGLPDGALPGIAVSTGVVEGRARVVTDMDRADLEPGDILVTAFTDPSWTPAFVTVSALVTEVGGVMTHGAVIAREYGLPAVVGVEDATRIIRDGQRIRVHGTEGYVEILS
ncbi:phosphoenolpyruvate synthase [Rhodococcus pyridinivorans]|uniref:phosphoenolpyruvate synthase n=1 Tax=Rhodococcus pyridinivorans TaxID=103816 RepID=UPI001FFE2D6D|nr:phosphoenolpyruvate synthase [Rhodococcus pyridinivorans]UPK63637.1 phosphoenolpyruvate synthase [Rhodococcus pyridinivorans]